MYRDELLALLRAVTPCKLLLLLLFLGWRESKADHFGVFTPAAEAATLSCQYNVAVMVFSSALFLFYFLPLFLAGYFLMPQRLKNAYLAFVSVAFYAIARNIDRFFVSS